MAQLGFMFPTRDCALCRGMSDHGYDFTRASITSWLLDFGRHLSIEMLTLTAIVSAGGQLGHFVPTERHQPRDADTQYCTNCNRCTGICPVELPDSSQMGTSMRIRASKCVEYVKRTHHRTFLSKYH